MKAVTTKDARSRRGSRYALGALTACLVALAFARCSRCAGSKPIVWTNPFPLTDERLRELCECEPQGGPWARERHWAAVAFGEPLRFRRVGETIDATAWCAITLLDTGRAYAGRYAMRAKPYRYVTGGPPGSATNLDVDVEGVHLVERLSPPPAPPGARAIVPGELVVRAMPDSEGGAVDDRYVVALASDQDVEVTLMPFPDQYGLALSVTCDGSPVPLQYKKFAYRFRTHAAAVYDLRVVAPRATGRRPDRYQLFVTWGEARTSGLPLVWDFSWTGGEPPEPKDGGAP